MKSKDQLLLEQAYLQIYADKTNNNLHQLIEADQNTLDRIIEENFGDFIKKVGSGIKGGAQKITSKIKETLSNGIATSLVKAIVSVIPKNELDNFVDIISKGQVPKDKANQVQQLIAQEPESKTQSTNVQESWVIGSLINEQLILEALVSSNALLTEIMANPAINQPQNKPKSKANLDDDLENYAVSIGNKIRAMYPKDKEAWATAIPKMATYMSKYLGVPLQSNTVPANVVNQPATPTSTSSQAQGQATTPSNGASSPTAAVGASSGNGLVSKVMGFIKKNPKISAAAGAALLGLTVAAFAGATPVIVPALLAALKGAGWSAAGSAVAQKMKGVGGALMDGGLDAAKRKFDNNEVDLKTTAKHAAIGGATAGLVKVLSIGLGNIAGMFDTVTVKQHAKHYSSDYGVGETKKELTQRKGLGSFTGKTSDYITTGSKDTGSWGYQGKA